MRLKGEKRFVKVRLAFDHCVFKIVPQVLAVSFALAQTACKIETKIKDAYYDRTAPDAAQALAWLDPSNGDTLVANGDFSRETSMKATWTPSTTTDMTAQGVQLYIGAACNIASGAPIRYSGVTQSNHVFNGLPDGAYSFKVISYDRKNNASFSTCSTAFVVDNSAPAIAITNAAAWINNSTKAAYTVTGTCTDSGSGIAGVVTVRLSLDGFNYVEQTTPCTTAGTFTINLNTTSPTDGALTDSNQLILTASVTDRVGNSNLTAGMNVSRDTVAPVLSGVNPAAYINITHRAAYTVGGNCSDTFPGLNGSVSVSVSVTDGTNTVTGASSCTGAGTFLISIDASSLSDTAAGAAANISITTSVTDVAGNITTTAAMTRKKDTIAPVLALVAPTTNTAIKGNSAVDVQFNVTEINVDTGVPVTISCTGCTAGSYNKTLTAGPLTTATTFTQAINSPNTHSAAVGISMTFSDAAGNPATAVTANYITDMDAPQVQSLVLNNNVTTTTNNNVLVALTANDPSSKITQFCLKYNTTTKPLISDSCWTNVNAPIPGITPALSIAFDASKQFYYQVGFSKANYSVRAWIRDEAGNISDNSNTISTDRFDIDFDPGSPPRVDQFQVANVDIPTNPIPSSQLQFTTGQSIFVKWRAEDTEGLKANGPISIQYTKDDVTYEVFSGATQLDNAQGAGCTLSEFAGDQRFSGCAVIPTPAILSNIYFRVRVVATDTQNTTVYFTSVPLNESRVRFIAGNTESGLNGSATTAVFTPFGVASAGGYAFNRKMIVTDDGKYFFIDGNSTLRIVDPSNNVLKIFIPTHTSIVDGDIATVARVRLPTALALDYQGNIWLWDYDRIRRINLATNTITTVIGGGSNTDTTTTLMAANSISLSAWGTSTTNITLIPLPNGDLLFQRSVESYIGRRYRAADGMIESYHFPTDGVGMGFNSDWPWSRSSAGGQLGVTAREFAVEFDPTTSQLLYMIKGFFRSYVGSAYTNYSRIDLTAAATSGNYYGMGPYDLSSIDTSGTYVGMNGKIYWSSQNRTNIYRVDLTSTTMTRVLLLGSGNVSTHGTQLCPEDTLATNCAVDIDSYFVSKTGRVYFIDQGVVRLIKDDGKVMTVFGQHPGYGNGVLAMNARFYTIQDLKANTAGGATDKYTIMDSGLTQFREFTVGGNINNITTTSNNWSGPIRFEMDAATGDLFSPRSGIIRRFIRSTGTWQNVVGSYVQTTPVANYPFYYNPEADGLPGLSLNMGYVYNITVSGIFNNEIYYDRYAWNGSTYVGCMVKKYAINDSYRQSNFMGSGSCVGTYTDGANMNSIGISLATMTNLNYSNSYSTFVFGRRNTTEFYARNADNTLKKLTNLPRSVYSLALVDSGSNQLSFYYCATNGFLYRYSFNSSQNLMTQSGTETLLQWSTPTLKCKHDSKIHVTSNNTIVFPYKMNGLDGVAEYVP